MPARGSHGRERDRLARLRKGYRSKACPYPPPGEPRCADGTSGAPGEGQTGVEADPALSESGTDGRRGGERANGRDAARRTAVAAAVEYPADRSGPRTGKTRASLLPLCG